MRCPPDSHLIIFPANICDPDRVFRLYYRYTLKLPICRSQARVDFSDLVYLVRYLLIPEGVLRQIVTKFYILPDHEAEIFVDALYHLATIEYSDFYLFLYVITRVASQHNLFMSTINEAVHSECDTMFECFISGALPTSFYLTFIPARHMSKYRVLSMPRS